VHRDAYKHTCDAERYEVNLACIRLNALLSSQSFLFLGWAALNNALPDNQTRLLQVAAPAVALVICSIALLSLIASVKVIGRWQKHGRRLIEEDYNGTDDRICDFHIDRPANDLLHFMGVNVFTILVPIAFIVLWLVVLAYAVHRCFA
jgi:hypothetical protein